MSNNIVYSDNTAPIKIIARKQYLKIMLTEGSSSFCTATRFINKKKLKVPQQPAKASKPASHLHTREGRKAEFA